MSSVGFVVSASAFSTYSSQRQRVDVNTVQKGAGHGVNKGGTAKC